MRNLLVLLFLSSTTLCSVQCKRLLASSSAKSYSSIAKESLVQSTKPSKVRGVMQVVGKSLAGGSLSVEVEHVESAEIWEEGIASDPHSTTFGGTQLHGLRSRSDFNINGGSTAYKVLRVRGGFSNLLRTRFQTPTAAAAEGSHVRTMKQRDYVSRPAKSSAASCRTMHTAAVATGGGVGSAAVVDSHRSYVAGLTAIANMCRSEPLEVSWEDFKRADFTLPSDRITRVCVTSKASVEEAPASVVGYILPRGMSWFSFKDDKQKGSAAQNALVVKNSTQLDRDVYNKTFQFLREKMSQVWAGHIGTGKSVEGNFIMMELLRNLGEQGWPKQVAHRIDGEIYYYELVDGRVSCSAVEGGGRTIHDVQDFCERNQDKQNSLVLVMDAGDDEMYGQHLGLPTFMALPSRTVERVLNTVLKCQHMNVAVRSPHSVEEALLVTEVMYTVDPEGTLRRAGVSPTASLEEFQAVMAQRIEEIGPVLREILHESRYLHFRRYAHTAYNAKRFLHTESLRYNNMPREAQYFVAPYAVNDDAIYGPYGELRFLCTKAALAVREVTTEEQEVAWLGMHGLDYQLAEALLMQVLLYSSPAALVKGWQRCVDPGYEHYLNRTHLVKKSPFRMPTAKRVVRFGTPILHKDASTMRDGDLYRSTLVSFPVSCEFFLYENSNGKRRITFYQTATGPRSQHPIPVAALKQWFEALGLYEQQNSDVEVVIEALVDWSHRNTKGMQFLGEQKEPMDIAGLRALFPGLTISTTIVRAPFYPNLSTAPKADLFKQQK